MSLSGRKRRLGWPQDGRTPSFFGANRAGECGGLCRDLPLVPLYLPRSVTSLVHGTWRGTIDRPEFSNRVGHPCEALTLACLAITPINLVHQRAVRSPDTQLFISTQCETRPAVSVELNLQVLTRQCNQLGREGNPFGRFLEAIGQRYRLTGSVSKLEPVQWVTFGSDLVNCQAGIDRSSGTPGLRKGQDPHEGSREATGNG